MKKTSLLLILFTVLSLGGFAQEQSPKKPNILFILTDDQDFSSIASWGGKSLTPHMDQLAKDGMKFTRAYATSPICTPSRYASLTGRYPNRCTHPQYEKKFPKGTIARFSNYALGIEKDGRNLQSVLKQNGYVTGMVGKWHIGEHIGGKMGIKHAQFGLERPDKNAPLDDPKADAQVKKNQLRYEEEIKKCGFDYTKNIYWANTAQVGTHALNIHNLEWTVKGATDFMEQNKDKPFFLYFATTLQHGPNPYDSLDVDPKYTGAGLSTNHLHVMPKRSGLKKRVTNAGFEKETAHHTWLDDGVGALLKKLDDLNLTDNTLVIFVTDHGIKAKASLYEGGIHVPMVIKWPGQIKPGTVCDELVSHIDIAPTIFDYCGIPLPENLNLDGQSLKPLLSGASPKWRKHLFMEIGYARAVRTKTHKYIAVRYPEGVEEQAQKAKDEASRKRLLGYIGNPNLCRNVYIRNKNYFSKDQLYHVAVDPKESTNLADDPNYQSKLKEMKTIMSSYLKTFPHRPFGELGVNHPE